MRSLPPRNSAEKYGEQGAPQCAKEGTRAPVRRVFPQKRHQAGWPQRGAKARKGEPIFLRLLCFFAAIQLPWLGRGMAALERSVVPTDRSGLKTIAP